jgi:hypothetical protein
MVRSRKTTIAINRSLYIVKNDANHPGYRMILRTIVKLRFAVAVVLLLGVVACSESQTHAQIEHHSPNNKVTVKISGSRLASVEPWKVDMKVKAYQFKEGSLSFEIYSGVLDSSTVFFDWKDDDHCEITFKQSDGLDKRFSVIASPTQLDVSGI